MDISFLPVIATIIFLVLAVFVISFALLFQQRQIQNLKQSKAMKAGFEQEIMKAQVEIQNSTLQRISQELHDNLGQILSVAKLNLNILEEMDKDPEEQAYFITQANEMVGQAINDLRELSKSLDADFVNEFGLEQSTTHELNRIGKTRRFLTHFSTSGEPYSIGQQKEIILFRIIQEILNNAIKHSNARNIRVAFDYSELDFNLTVVDDGIGFDWRLLQKKELSNSGSGLRNIQRRVNLIGGTCEFDSIPDQGTTIKIRVTE